ncbi:winged helix-turn-helix domain-containing protein [Erwinia tasmaniensis]|uniref:Regulatory protein n=1 Tax=Erwinia tasmaniensis (strain DSM 17950 / CFBP 7177 / CIP 109463 / NCPPB 4357 / Et1/99) TaxID=465817 RepID=B2VGF0_ERWT9|nr:transcriptional regulator [Erwinia tasmaniensis]CAO95509.1 Putative regulatory protein [Erwinia tasmaniensis Et1/99]
MTVDCIINHWGVDFASGTLLHQDSGEQRRLGEYQLKLLRVLAENAGKTFSREELNHLVWERRVIGNNSLPNAIHALRVALEDDGKLQKVIKTIPKKGYILEAEFCEMLSNPQSKTQMSEADAAIEQHAQAEPELETAVSHPSYSAPGSEHHQKPAARKLWYWLVPLQAVLLIALLVWMLIPRDFWFRTQIREQDAGVYSNIRLLELHRRNEKTSAAGELSKQLEPAFYSLNQILKNKQVNMEVFFFSSGVSLNYTLTLKSRCGSKQLAMNIVNWRMNGNLLSALIYRESERKLNEMANCVN